VKRRDLVKQLDQSRHSPAPRREAFRAILLAGVCTIIITTILTPALRRAKIYDGPTCTDNLKFIQDAKQMRAEDLHITNDVSFTKEQLLPYLGGRWPQCPKGGEYSIGTLRQLPRCSYHDHANLSVPTK